MQDFYEPKTLAGVIRRTPPRKMFFKNRYFSNPVMFPTETVTFEFQEGKRKLAPYVNPRLGSESIEREGYERKTFSTPLIAPNRVITSDTLAQKLLGESEQDGKLTIKGRGVKL